MKAFHQMSKKERKDYQSNLSKVLKEQVESQRAVVKCLNYLGKLLKLRVETMPGGIDYTKK
jgi:hypothetical protein